MGRISEQLINDIDREECIDEEDLDLYVEGISMVYKGQGGRIYKYGGEKVFVPTPKSNPTGGILPCSTMLEFMEDTYDDGLYDALESYKNIEHNTNY